MIKKLRIEYTNPKSYPKTLKPTQNIFNLNLVVLQFGLFLTTYFIVYSRLVNVPHRINLFNSSYW